MAENEKTSGRYHRTVDFGIQNNANNKIETNKRAGVNRLPLRERAPSILLLYFQSDWIQSNSSKIEIEEGEAPFVRLESLCVKSASESIVLRCQTITKVATKSSQFFLEYVTFPSNMSSLSQKRALLS